MSFLQSRTSLDLRNWKLTLPISTYKPPDPDEVKQPDLARYRSESSIPTELGMEWSFLHMREGRPRLARTMPEPSCGR